FRVLLAVAAGEPHSAHDLAVHHHREAADERGDAALEAPLDAEGLVAGQRRAVRRRSEKMGRALVAGGGERLVPGDLRPGDAGAVHALERDRVAAVVDDADRLRHFELLGFLERRLRHGARFGELELERGSHSPWYTVLICV